MGAERRETLLKALVVADVGQDDVEESDAASLAAGNGQPGAREERREPHGLQRDGLSPRVRPADDHRATGLEGEVARYDLPRKIEREEQVPGALQIEPWLVDEVWERERRVPRQHGRRGPNVGQSERSCSRLCAGQRVGDERRQLREHRLLFAFDVGLQHFEPVAHGHHRPRLDEECRPTCARRVDDPRKALVGVAPDRQDPAAFALRDEAILEHPFVTGHQVFHARKHALAGCVPLAAKLAQARACAIRERAVGVEAVDELVGQRVERRVGGARLDEGGQLGAKPR